MPTPTPLIHAGTPAGTASDHRSADAASTPSGPPPQSAFEARFPPLGRMAAIAARDRVAPPPSSLVAKQKLERTG